MVHKAIKGIRIIEPNEVIANDYIKKADNALEMMMNSPNDEWKVVGAYYACYEALYALFQKAGIKCEIHDCTIELMIYFSFSDAEKKFLRNLKEQRINAQYYVDRPFYTEDGNKIKDFVLLCKRKFIESDFDSIRKNIRKIIK